MCSLRLADWLRWRPIQVSLKHAVWISQESEGRTRRWSELFIEKVGESEVREAGGEEVRQ